MYSNVNSLSQFSRSVFHAGTKAFQAEFDDFIQNNQVVVIDFTAAWCGPCKKIAPAFEALSSEFSGLAFGKVDVDTNQEAAESQGVRSMPTFIFYKLGVEVDRFSGANESKLKEFIAKYNRG